MLIPIPFFGDHGDLVTAALTAITDNAALTYLGSLVEGTSEAWRYMLVAGAVTGGGLGVKDGTAGNAVAGLNGDYVLAAQPVVAAVSQQINPAQLLATARITGADKTYDGLLAATGSSISGSTSGALNGDSVALNLSGMTLAFDNAHAGARSISASGNAALGAVTGVGVGLKNGTAGNAVAGQAGDYVLADRSAVIFISPENIERVLEAAEMIVAKEAAMAKAILSGTPIGEVMGGNYEHMLEN